MSNIPLNIDWQQILLHVLNFVILFGGLYFLLYKPVKNFMAKREAHYAEMAQKAQSELDSAEKIQADYQEQLKSGDQAKADQWLQQQSFEKALVNPKQTLDELKQLGWSTDALRFQDLGNRLAKPAAAKA